MDYRISNFGNTLAPAYRTLVAKGYAVTVEHRSEDERPGPDHWEATGPLGRFAADDSVTLLGLVAMREHRGEQWKPTDDEVRQFMRLLRR